jgi:hypothetical protein
VALQLDVVRQRLHNQRLTRSELRKPDEVVGWLGAVQSQDFAGAKWGIGLRGHGITDASVDWAFNEGTILRTHLLRPTWHLVARADLRWMLMLTAPRVHAANAYCYRQCELESRTFVRSRKVIERALEGGTHLTRAELAAIMLRAGIPAAGVRLAYLMMRAELDAVVCSGARRGKQFTYALVDERVPCRTRLTREEALAELTRRYFSSHGPATVRDFAWWSGLTIRDATTGVALVTPALEQETIATRTYWFGSSKAALPRPSPSVHLLPNYDEFLIAYKDRESVPGSGASPSPPTDFDTFGHFLVMDGRLAGTWRRRLTADAAVIDAVLFRRPTRAHTHALAVAAKRYGSFMNLTVECGARVAPGAST